MPKRNGSLHPPIRFRRTKNERESRASLLGASEVPDAELLVRVGRQEHEALAALYDRYSRRVYSIGIQVLRNDGQAEEMTQDVFVSVWR